MLLLAAFISIAGYVLLLYWIIALLLSLRKILASCGTTVQS